MLLTWLLAALHVISAIAWLGGGILFGFVIAPGLAKLSPGSSGEFMVKIVPGAARFFKAAAGMTILFGLLLLWNLGGLSLFDLGTAYGVILSVGVSLALVSFLISELVAAPSLERASNLIKGMVTSGSHEPPAELAPTMRLVTMSSMILLILLLATAVCMVGAGFY